MGGYRTTVEPQRVDDPRADSEWKADPGLPNLVHGEGDAVSWKSKFPPLIQLLPVLFITRVVVVIARLGLFLPNRCQGIESIQ